MCLAWFLCKHCLTPMYSVFRPLSCWVTGSIRGIPSPLSTDPSYSGIPPRDCLLPNSCKGLTREGWESRIFRAVSQYLWYHVGIQCSCSLRVCLCPTLSGKSGAPGISQTGPIDSRVSKLLKLRAQNFGLRTICVSHVMCHSKFILIKLINKILN